MSGPDGEERRVSDRRSADNRFHLRPTENWYRDLILLIVCIFLFIGNGNANQAADDAKEALSGQKTGRRVALNVICGAENATINAGRAIITGSASSVTPELERNLRALGYPPRKVREETARKAADEYARSIAEGVRRIAGGGNADVVRSNGTLDCDKLLEASRAK